MSFINNIKNNIGRWLLHRNNKLNSGELKLFKDVQNICIAYNATEKNTEEQINKFANELRGLGKKVFLMGYVDLKQLPHTKKFHITSEFFWLEQLNWFNLPDKNKLHKVLNEPFDLLMNVYFNDNLPLQALSMQSKARYKIGSNSPLALNYNHALIDVADQNRVYELARQMQHYLSVINQ